MGGTTTWRHVLRSAALGIVVMVLFLAAVPLVADGAFDPATVVIAGLFVAGGWWAGRPGKGGVIFTGVLSLLLGILVLGLFQSWKAFAHPESTFDFIATVGLLVVTVLAVVAAIPALDRERLASPGPLLLRGAGVVIAVGVVVGAVAGLSTSSDTKRAGDIEVDMKDFAFAPRTISHDTSPVTFFVKNRDTSHHDFTIDDLVHQQVPSGVARRVTIDTTLERRTYRFYCTLHPGMDGTITVR